MRFQPLFCVGPLVDDCHRPAQAEKINRGFDGAAFSDEAPTNGSHQTMMSVNDKIPPRSSEESIDQRPIDAALLHAGRFQHPSMNRSKSGETPARNAPSLTTVGSGSI